LDARSGFRYYGLTAVATLLSRARAVLEKEDDVEFQEGELDQHYAEIIPDDSSLVERFEKHLEANPTEYAPL
jgi:hypothetical protein